MTTADARTLALAASALVARPVSDGDARRLLARLAAASPPRITLGLRLLLWLVRRLPLVVLGTLRPFAALTQEQRVALWNWALGHRRYLVRQMALGLKGIVCLLVYEPDELREASA